MLHFSCKNVSTWDNCLFVFCPLVYLPFLCLLFAFWAALQCIAAKMSQPGRTGPEDDYTQHYAAENGSTSANGTKYLEKERGCKFDFFAQGSVSREPIKAGDKSPLSSATRKFELKICFFLLSTKKKDGLVLSLVL